MQPCELRPSPMLLPKFLHDERNGADNGSYVNDPAKITVNSTIEISNHNNDY